MLLMMANVRFKVRNLAVECAFAINASTLDNV